MKKFIQLLYIMTIVFLFSFIHNVWAQNLVPPETSEIGIPDTQLPINPDGQLPINPDGQLPINPDSQLPINPDSQLPINTDSELNQPEELINIRIQPGTRLENLRMISFPLQMENIDSRDVFPQIQAKDYENDFRIGSYDPVKGGYNEFGSNLKIKQGRALWILAKNGLDISVRQPQADQYTDFDLELYYNPGTGDGWNMIACPDNKTYDWKNDIQVFKQNESGQITGNIIDINSSDNDLVDVVLWKWKNGTYTFYDPLGKYEHEIYKADQDVNASLIIPEQGYWVRAKAENVWLRFPGTVSAKSFSTETYIISFCNKTKIWLKNRIFSPESAAADSGQGPPLPISGISSSDGSAGCFIKSAVCD